MLVFEHWVESPGLHGSRLPCIIITSALSCEQIFTQFHTFLQFLLSSLQLASKITVLLHHRLILSGSLTTKSLAIHPLPRPSELYLPLYLHSLALQVFSQLCLNAQSSSVYSCSAHLPVHPDCDIYHNRLRHLPLLWLLCLVTGPWLSGWNCEENLLWICIARVDCYCNHPYTCKICNHNQKHLSKLANKPCFVQTDSSDIHLHERPQRLETLI